MTRRGILSGAPTSRNPDPFPEESPRVPVMYFDAINAVIDDGIEAARLDYTKPDDNLKLNGSIKGFEECRGKTPVQLTVQLAVARARAQQAQRERAADYWYWRCRAAEIEWVCNVISVLLMQHDLPTIVPPTVRGMLKAMDIAGIKKP